MKNILLIILTNLVLGLAAQVEIPAPKQTKNNQHSHLMKLHNKQKKYYY